MEKIAVHCPHLRGNNIFSGKLKPLDKKRL